MAVKPGLRDAVTIAGYSLALPPNSTAEAVQAKPVYLETVEYFVDTTAHVDRPIAWGDELRGIASPDVIRKWQIGMTWDQLNRRDYIALHEIQSRPDSVEVCLWRPIVETFTCDGVKRHFSLSARPAVREDGFAYVTSPPQGFEAYATQVYKNGVLTSGVTGFGNTADVLGRLPFQMPSPTGAAYAKGTVIEVYYVPVFRCRRAGAECTFPVAQRETLALHLEQIG